MPKLCTVCKEMKDDFYRDRKRPDGLSGRCTDCQKAKNKAYWKTYYPANRERLIPQIQATQKPRRSMYRTAARCITCGKQAESSRTRCRHCLDRCKKKT